MKFGGTSVADAERLKHAARRIVGAKEAGSGVVAVLSARGATTDELVTMAQEISPEPHPREMDMLLSTGERISCALCAMAIHDLGSNVISLSGSQAGIVTDTSHTKARILDVRADRIRAALAEENIVLVAGFQGVSTARDVTTLGRGGSDTTAVALAAALDAEACEIYSDVEGVYTADPRVVPDARRLAELSYEEMQELAESGAKVLNAQAVEFAKERGIAIYARATRGGEETVVRMLPPRAPGRVVGVASETGLVSLSARGADTATVSSLLALLDEHETGGKQFHLDAADGTGTLSLVLSLDNLHDFARLRQDLASRLAGRVALREQVGAVSAIGAGINARFQNLRRALEVLSVMGVTVRGASTSSFRISLLVDEKEVPEAVRRLHRALVTEGEPPRSPTD
jgi:aspartate kinase